MERKTNITRFSSIEEYLHNDRYSYIHEHKEQRLSVAILLKNYKQPLVIKVPRMCNMKILKSMILFNVRKHLDISHFKKIIGLQCHVPDYQLDYKIQRGIGQLQTNLTLKCLLRSSLDDQDSMLNYKVCKILSTGGFSKVYLLRDLKNGQFRVGKFILKTEANIQLIRNQYEISSKVTHPFIVKTHNFIEIDHFYVIILEYCPKGELFDLLKLNRHMKEQEARFYIVEMLLALRYLHEKSIIFRDVKPENILIADDGHIKLVDFGLAKHIRGKTFSFCGSLDYMAPEILEDKGHSYEVDYYAVGNLMYQILAGSPPFYHPRSTPQQTKYHILHTSVKYPRNLSTQALSLLDQLLKKESSARLGSKGGIDQILAHEWFKDINLEAYVDKEISPPFIPELKISINLQEQNYNEIKHWAIMIKSDIRQAQMKKMFRNTCSVKNNPRYRSLNSQNSYQSNEFDQNVERPYKIGANIFLKDKSALSVLAHKRSSTGSFKAHQKKNISNKMVNKLNIIKSLNASKKNSVYKSELQSNILNHQQFQSNKYVITGKKYKDKENILKKKKKTVELFKNIRNY